MVLQPWRCSAHGTAAEWQVHHCRCLVLVAQTYEGWSCQNSESEPLLKLCMFRAIFRSLICIVFGPNAVGQGTTHIAPARVLPCPSQWILLFLLHLEGWFSFRFVCIGWVWLWPLIISPCCWRGCKELVHVLLGRPLPVPSCRLGSMFIGLIGILWLVWLVFMSGNLVAPLASLKVRPSTRLKKSWKWSPNLSTWRKVLFASSFF